MSSMIPDLKMHGEVWGIVHRFDLLAENRSDYKEFLSQLPTKLDEFFKDNPGLIDPQTQKKIDGLLGKIKSLPADQRKGACKDLSSIFSEALHSSTEYCNKMLKHFKGICEIFKATPHPGDIYRIPNSHNIKLHFPEERDRIIFIKTVLEDTGLEKFFSEHYFRDLRELIANSRNMLTHDLTYDMGAISEQGRLEIAKIAVARKPLKIIVHKCNSVEDFIDYLNFTNIFNYIEVLITAIKSFPKNAANIVVHCTLKNQFDKFFQYNQVFIDQADSTKINEVIAKFKDKSALVEGEESSFVVSKGIVCEEMIALINTILAENESRFKSACEATKKDPSHALDHINTYHIIYEDKRSVILQIVVDLLHTSMNLECQPQNSEHWRRYSSSYFCYLLGPNCFGISSPENRMTIGRKMAEKLDLTILSSAAFGQMFGLYAHRAKSQILPIIMKRSPSLQQLRAILLSGEVGNYGFNREIGNRVKDYVSLIAWDRGTILIDNLIDIMLLSIRSYPREAFDIINEGYLDEFFNAPHFKELRDYVIKHFVDVKEREELLNFTYYYAGLCIGNRFESAKLVKYLPYVYHIIHFENAALRYPLVTAMIDHDFTPPISMPQNSLAVHLLLEPLLKGFGLNDEQSKRLFKILELEDYKSNKEKALNAIIRLINCKELSLINKGDLLKHIYSSEEKGSGHEKKPATNLLLILEAIIISGKTAKLVKASANAKEEIDVKGAAAVGCSTLVQPLVLSEILDTIFMEALSGENETGLKALYQETFGSLFTEFLANEEKRFVVAFEETRKSPNRALSHISLYKIFSEKYHFEIARIVADIEPDAFINVKFDNFKISLENRIAIAKIVAQKIDIEIFDFSNFISNFVSIFAIRKTDLVNEVLPIFTKRCTSFSEIQRLWGLGIKMSEYTSQGCDRDTLLRIMLLAFKAYPDCGYDIVDNFESEQFAAPHFKEIEGRIAKNFGDNDALFNEHLFWTKYYAGLCIGNKLSDATIAKYSPYIEQIMDFKNPALRYPLVTAMIDNDATPSKDVPQHSLLFHLLLDPLLKNFGLNGEQSKSIFTILEHEDYKYSVRKEIVVRALLSLIECDQLSPINKGDLLKHIFCLDKKNELEISQNQKRAAINLSLQTLDAIILSENAEKLVTNSAYVKEEADIKGAAAKGTTLVKPLKLSEILNVIFVEAIGIKKTVNFDKRYLSTIGEARSPASMQLLIYAGKLCSLSGNEKEATLNVLKEFTQAVLRGTKKYQDWRYQELPGSHLETVFGRRVGLKEAWQKGEGRIPYESLVKSSNESIGSEMTTSKIVKMLHEFSGHIKDAELESLNKYCASPTPKLASEVLKKLDEEEVKLATNNASKNVQQADNKTKAEAQSKEAMLILDKRIDKLKFQRVYIQLLSYHPDSSVEANANKMTALNKLIKKLYKNSEIERNIDDLQKLIAESTPQSISKGLMVVDTDDWADLLLCGDEVVGSCQRIIGDVYYNKCLLAYLADGKNRMIAVKDAQGKILGRCIMRLLWDETSKKPVIFQERFYHSLGAPKEAQKAIYNMFIQRAKTLEVSLVRLMVDGETTEQYPNDLESINSPAPFEYVDALNEVTDGCYAVSAKGLQKVYMPPQKG